MVSIPLSITVDYIHGTDEGCKRVSAKPNILIYQIPSFFAGNLISESELKTPGIYFLVKNSEPSIYVGQADSHDDGSGILKRMMGKHSEGIDAWDVGYALTSGTPNFLQATELNWLEQVFYDKAKETGRYKLLNNVRPHANEPDFSTKAVLSSFIDNALFILPRVLQCYAFEPLNSDLVPVRFSDSELIGRQLFLTSHKNKAYAMGVLTGHKSIYVYQGASIGKTNNLLSQKGNKGYGLLREELEEKGIIDGVLTTGYEFLSPSQAACIIMGVSISANDIWKDKDGHTLGELKKLGINAVDDGPEETANEGIAETDVNKPSDMAVKGVAAFTDALMFVSDTDSLASGTTKTFANKIGSKKLLFLNNNKRNAHARGYLTGEKSILVLKGSKVSDIVFFQNQKKGEGPAKHRNNLESDGTIVNGVFFKDYEFPSTSAAATIILGGSASGMDHWKNADGVALGSLLKDGVNLIIDEKDIANEASEPPRLNLTSRGADAYGYNVENGGFKVLEGSKISPDVTEGFKDMSLNSKREELLKSGIVKDGVFLKDYVFSSPSTAASVIGGGSISGAAWKEA